MTSKSITLFMSPGSCTTAVHILLKETGVTFSTTSIEVRQGFPAEFLHLNTKGRVPILLMDNEMITETPAIITAIAQLAPEKRLLGKSDLEIVRSYEWFNFLSAELHLQGYFLFYRPHYFSSDETAFASIQEKGLEKVKKCYQIIEERIAAVHALLPFYRWGVANELEMDKYPKYTKAMKQLAKRHSVQEACKDEGIDALRGERLL
ncbi:hypothetical protein BS50DRAFT_586029 [Corynespora cassiicola Philippines]|uniref:GST N-terminal domain-containing protein n=1 Tax=Corynespora cassiicola Philippines TaxID=1448308 RepID=A0A2T2NT72_CORCC|nr:hypothetical protein BS50DRAFT_586029 [Corynespora cassiicola Philippines]